MNILEVKNLKKYYKVKKSFNENIDVKALDDVSFTIQANKTLGIVGESGCGKSTLAKTLLQLEDKTGGEIVAKGTNVSALSKKEFKSFIQMIFQDPFSSLNPRKKAWQIIAEPLFINTNFTKKECYEKALEMMNNVGLRPELANRYPHMFSGGQRQRIGIARALILHPQVLICDEPVSALDVSIQAQVINLLIDLQDNMKLTYLFISHDLSVVNHISDYILVMYLGKIVEYGARDKVFDSPSHPYTKALIASSPGVTRESESYTIEGELPSPLNPPQGCAFHKRCPYATVECRNTKPILREWQSKQVACHELENI